MRILGYPFGVDNGEHLLRRNHVFRVFEHHKIVLRNCRGGRVQIYNLHGVILQGLDGECPSPIRKRDEFRRNAPVFIFEPRNSVGAFGKFGSGTNLQFGTDLRHIIQGAQIVFLGGLLGDD